MTYPTPVCVCARVCMCMCVYAYETYESSWHARGVRDARRTCVCVCACVRACVYVKCGHMCMSACVCGFALVCLEKTARNLGRRCECGSESYGEKNACVHTATHCNTLQHTATHCNALQHTATHATHFITQSSRESYVKKDCACTFRFAFREFRIQRNFASKKFHFVYC